MELELSIIALIFSFISVITSVYAVWRNSRRLKVYAEHYSDEQNQISFVGIDIVNTGRRPIFIKYLVRRYAEGESRNSIQPINTEGYELRDIIENKHQPPLLRLGEGEYHRIAINMKEPNELWSLEFKNIAKDIRIEDVGRKQYKVKRFRESLEKAVAEQKAFTTQQAESASRSR